MTCENWLECNYINNNGTPNVQCIKFGIILGLLFGILELTSYHIFKPKNVVQQKYIEDKMKNLSGLFLRWVIIGIVVHLIIKHFMKC